MLESHRVEGTVVEQFSGRSLKYFEEEMTKILNEVAKEAMNGNYYKLSPIDIKRGIDKWIRSKIMEVKVSFLED
jgi:hypothetical protein